MVDGYIVYDSFYYASEYIKQIDDTPGAVVWDDQQDEDKREWELQMNEKRHMIKSKWSRWISVATHLFQLAQNNFLAILAIYYF
jgi:hypothetical protein